MQHIVRERQLLELTDKGLYCAVGNFFIDPIKRVQKALITHAHSDHSISGHDSYLATKSSELVMKARLGNNLNLQLVAYGEEINICGVKISFHPAGHILGSAQIRIEYKGEVWVASGDYKLEADKTCEQFEPIKCHVFISEATFGLPVYRWPEVHSVFSEINTWWLENQRMGKTSIIFAYSLGKAQRILSSVNEQIGTIFTHGAVENINTAYRDSFIKLPETTYVGTVSNNKDFEGSLVIAPPSAQHVNWLKRFGHYSTAFASGWMLARAGRRRRGLDRGFVLSDHADWTGLLKAIKATEAERVLVTHGYTNQLSRWLNENGVNAEPLEIDYSGEEKEDIIKGAN